MRGLKATLTFGSALCVLAIAAAAAHADPRGGPGSGRAGQAARVEPVLPFQPAVPADAARQALTGAAGSSAVRETPRAVISWHEMEKARRLNRDRAAALRQHFLMDSRRRGGAPGVAE